MKKIIALVLVSCMLLFTLVACGGNNNETQPPVANGTTSDLGTDEFEQSRFPSAVPDKLDFEEEEILIYSRNGDNITREWYKENPGEDTLDQAIVHRNDTVSEKLNLTFKLELDPGHSNWDQMVINYNQVIVNDVANGHNYDMYAHQAYCAAYLDLRGCQANMMNKDIFPYFNFELPCWNAAIVDNAVNNKLLYIAGDLNLSLFDSTVLIWHNKTLYDSEKTEDDPADLQDLALAGKWTYDQLYYWASLKKDEGTGKACDNTYGVSDLPMHFYSAIPSAWGFELVKKNADGTYSYNILENTMAENALTDLRALSQSKGVASSCNCDLGSVGHFAQGQYMFLTSVLYPGEDANTKIRDMTDKFCILPLPKMYEDQESYGTGASAGYNLVSVLNHPEDLIKGDAISAFYQLSTELSYTDVRAVYIERIVKPRFFGVDDEDGTVTKSIDIFDIIASTTKFTIVDIYSASLRDIGWLWQDNVDRSDKTLADAFKSNENSGGGLRTQEDYEKALASFNAFMWDIG